MQPGVYFITGIDTDIGKTISTGLLARWLSEEGQTVITQKMVQTGCVGISEDIECHRKIMGIDLLPEDTNHLSCPYVFAKPCSPHLAAEKEGVVIDPSIIEAATADLLQIYDFVLLEGAGGLCAPLTRDVTTLDYVEKKNYPLIIVSSSRLGSLHHTLCLLEIAQTRGLMVRGIIYNRFGEKDCEIGDDSKQLIQGAMKKFGYTGPVIDLVEINEASRNKEAFIGLFETI